MRIGLKGFFPVCILSENIFLLYKEGIFYSLEYPSEKIRKIAKLRLSILEQLLFKIPFASRLLRLGVRCSLKISEHQILFVLNEKIYELNLFAGTISKGFKPSGNCRPLIFSQIIGIKGFEDGVYFGGYSMNPEKKTVPIYKRVSEDKWICIYQFSQGAIEHVHNIVADKNSDSVFIFSGDYDHSAAIWIAKNNFSSVETVLGNEQTFRGCIAFPTPEGILYATDSPYSDNSIRLLKKNIAGDWISEFIRSINGPVIYGCEWGNDYVFSTSVEGDGLSRNLMTRLLDRSLGKGVKDYYAYIYKGNVTEGFKIIYKARKDILPFYLFQLGLLIFPSGKNNSLVLPTYHLATKKYDMTTVVLSMDYQLNKSDIG